MKMIDKILQAFDGSPYNRLAWKYAKDVLEGTIIAGEFTVKSCQRAVDDMTSERISEQFVYDPVKAARVIKFVQMLEHQKGRWKGQKFILEPWQMFILSQVFGWVHKDTGMRRFREAYIEVARKAGKSLLSAAVGVYMLGPDGENSPEVFCGATGYKQASAVFMPMAQMIKGFPEYCEEFGVQVRASDIRCKDGGKAERLIGNPGDGDSPSCGLIDEYHEHKSSALYDTVLTGTGAREQPLIFITTTAGNDLGGVCFDKHLDCQRVLRGEVVDDALFTIIYHADRNDDWSSDEALMKANPNIGVSISMTALQREAETAKQQRSKQAAFKTKKLNLWGGSSTSWLDLDAWMKCGDPDLNEADYLDYNLDIGLDMSSTLDLTAIARIYSKTIDGKLHYYFFVNNYLPQGTIDKDQSGRYNSFVKDGSLIAQPGTEIDIDAVELDVLAAYEKCTSSHNRVVFDAWNAKQLKQHLEETGVEMLEFRMNYSTANPAMMELEAAIAAGRFHHNGSTMMAWQASNLVAKRSSDDLVKPGKMRDVDKIDGIVAAIMGIGGALEDAEDAAPDLSYLLADQVISYGN